MFHPLPDLSTANLSGCGIFHQVVNGHAANPAQPRFQILNTHVEIPAQTGFGNVSFRNRDQIGGGNLHFRAHDGNLIRSLHVLVEDFFRKRHKARMGHPRPIVTGFDLAQFIGANFIHRQLVGGRVVLNRHLRRHAAHGVYAAAVTGLNQQIHVRLQEVPVHGDFGAVGKHEARMIAEFLDKAEDIIPAPAIETGGMIAQFIENLIHLVGAQDGLNQYRGADGASRNAHCILGKVEYVIPKAGFQMTLHLGQIEIGPGSNRHLLLHVMEEVQAEIEQ